MSVYLSEGSEFKSQHHLAVTAGPVSTALNPLPLSLIKINVNLWINVADKIP